MKKISFDFTCRYKRFAPVGFAGFFGVASLLRLVKGDLNGFGIIFGFSLVGFLVGTKLRWNVVDEVFDCDD
jgi:hypothetical protein